MREPAFWRRPRALAGWLLAPLGAIYGAIAAWRMALPGAAAGIPVICIGNLTVGGAGKTPAAMLVAQLLQQAGKRPFVLSRGYGGRFAGPIEVDAQAHGAADVGDEPLLLARVAPTVVARDRVAGAQAARTVGADVIVMDDGFQNPSLKKDLSPGGGRWRDAASATAACFLPVRCALRWPRNSNAPARCWWLARPSGAEAVLAAARGLPVFYGRLEPDAQAVTVLRPHKALAFAGIGDPEKFFGTLAEAGIDVRARQAFPDHHRYSAAEAADLIAQAEREGLTLVTTEKDLARLKGEAQLETLARQARALPVRLVVTEADAFRQFVLKAAG